MTLPRHSGRRGEHLPVGAQPAQDVLGQFGPVDPDDQLSARRRLGQRADVCFDVGAAGPLAQGRGVDAQRVDAHAGDMATVDDTLRGPVDLSPQQRLTAVEEGVGPPLAQETRVVGAQHAIEYGPADVIGKDPVVVHRRPGRVREVRDPDAGHEFPQHPRDQRQVVVLHEHASRGWLRRRTAGERARERLVVRDVGLPVAPECGPEARLDRGVEQQMMDEPQRGVGYGVVGALKGVGRDVQRTDRGPASGRAAGLDPEPAAVRVLAGRLAVGVTECRADPHHLSPVRKRRQAGHEPGHQAAAAAPCGQAPVRGQGEGKRAAVRRDQQAAAVPGGAGARGGLSPRGALGAGYPVSGRLPGVSIAVGRAAARGGLPGRRLGTQAGVVTHIPAG